jgi:hypothetical protein
MVALRAEQQRRLAHPGNAQRYCLLEDVMNKTLIAIVSAAFAVTSMFASSAQAGFKGKFAIGLAVGALLAHQHYEHEHWRKRHIYVQRRTEKVYVSRKTSKNSDDVAKVDTPAVDTADNENSSITTAALTPAEQPTVAATTEAVATTTPAAVDPKPAETTEAGPQTAKKLDCKKFFPSVGMTLTVPCE